MLTDLTVENFLLIERVHLEPSEKLNVVTGETGAGKSLIVSALNFLFCADAGGTSGALLKPDKKNALVTGRFVLQDAAVWRTVAEATGVELEKDAGAWELVVVRTIFSSGKTKAYLNGRPVSVAVLRALGAKLLDIHGQHENQSLLRADTLLEILDDYVGAENERAEVGRLWREARRAAGALREARQAARHREEQLAFLRFRLDELDKLRLDELDEDALRDELKIMRSAEKVRAGALEASEALGADEWSAVSAVGKALRLLKGLGDVGSGIAALVESLADVEARLQSISRELDDLAEKAGGDPERLNELEERLSSLNAAERRYGATLAQLRERREQLRSEAEALEHLDAHLRELRETLSERLTDLDSACKKLTAKRRQAAKSLEVKAEKAVKSLGLSGASLRIALAPHPPKTENKKAAAALVAAASVKSEDAPDAEESSLLPENLRETGAERAEILFSANRDFPPRALRECASGGELSRVMLALKGVLAESGGADRLPVVVFDEIDGGVGGRLGSVLGVRLAALAKVRQIFCITHLPQLAAYADAHIKVEKHAGEGKTDIRAVFLNENQRVEELAEMLRGNEAGRQTMVEARAMLRAAAERRGK